MRLLAAIFAVSMLCGAQVRSAEDLIRLSTALQAQGKMSEAAAAMRELLARPGLSPALTGIALNELGLALHERNQFEEAEAAYRRSIRLLEPIREVDPAFLMRAHMNLSSLYIETDRTEAAARERDAVSVEKMTDAADQIQALNLSAALALMRGHLDQAYDAYLGTLGFIQRYGTTAHRTQMATTLNNLGTISFRRGRMAEAERWTTEAIAAQRMASGDMHPNVMKVLTNLAQIRIALHDDRGAAESLHEALNIARTTLGDQHAVTATILDNYARVLRRTGKKREAKAAQREAELIRAELPRAIPAGVGTVDVKAFTKSARPADSGSARTQTAPLR